MQQNEPLHLRKRIRPLQMKRRSPNEENQACSLGSVDMCGFERAIDVIVVEVV
jgi:hypothetical protein